MGRISNLTPELIAKLSNQLLIGSYVETAVALLGINKESFYEWLRKGRAKQDPLCEALVDAVEKAQAEAEQRDLYRIDKAVESGTWQAAAWKLERRNPRKWGRRDHMTLEGGENPVQFALTKGQLKEMAKEILYGEQETEEHRNDSIDEGEPNALQPRNVAELPVGTASVEDSKSIGDGGTGENKAPNDIRPPEAR